MKVDKMILICGKNCMPCRQLENWMNEHHIEVETIFSEEHIDLCRKYNVLQTPTLVLIEYSTTDNGYEAHLTYSGFEDVVKYFENH